MSVTNPMLMCDFYKLSHRDQYPEGTEFIYSTFTPRTSFIPGMDKVVVFGIQGFIQEYLVKYFNDNFFSKDVEEVIKEYQHVVSSTLGPDAAEDVTHIRELHSVGYLPLLISSLPEGTIVPLKTPVLSIENTDSRFPWLVGYLETLMSCSLWQPMTSATKAAYFRQLLDHYAEETGGPLDFVQFQGHDFSMRGLSSLESAKLSGAGHLTSFVGTDTIPAIQYVMDYYETEQGELVGTSIPATEHSVQCAYSDDEAYLMRMITEVYPTGMVSIVSDGYDFWHFISQILPTMKEYVLARDTGSGFDKVVIRPDSGDPVKIITGDDDAPAGSLEHRGAIEVLNEIFGSTVNEKGFKQLNPLIGLIYGDSITLERADQISQRLKAKGFASTNVVYGIGSFTYQYNTRDSFGFAMKASEVTINGVAKDIFKAPKTGDGMKKSFKGRVRVVEQDGELRPVHKMSPGFEDYLSISYLDGRRFKDTFADIRERLAHERRKLGGVNK